MKGFEELKRRGLKTVLDDLKLHRLHKHQLPTILITTFFLQIPMGNNYSTFQIWTSSPDLLDISLVAERIHVSPKPIILTPFLRILDLYLYCKLFYAPRFLLSHGLEESP